MVIFTVTKWKIFMVQQFNISVFYISKIVADDIIRV